MGIGPFWNTAANFVFRLDRSPKPFGFSIHSIHFSFGFSTVFRLTLAGMARYFNHRKVRHAASAFAKKIPNPIFRGDSCRLSYVVSWLSLTMSWKN